MLKSDYGKIAQEEIINTNIIRNEIEINKFVVMPNHIHIIIEISGDFYKQEQAGVCNTPLQSPSKTVGAIVRGIKGVVTRKIGFSIWQRGYYDHIIRSENEYVEILEYIENNPLKWELDKYYNA